MSEPNEVKEILIDYLIHQTLIERSNIFAEKEKTELYNKACELGREKLKDNSKPFFENWRNAEE
jgi:hypothetical protein